LESEKQAKARCELRFHALFEAESFVAQFQICHSTKGFVCEACSGFTLSWRGTRRVVLAKTLFLGQGG
jgi:hypothetical protein